jgi:hypothetical protein
MGRRAAAAREGERGVALEPVSKDAYLGPYLLHQLARIYTLTGDYDRAIATLDSLLRIPYLISAGWLRIDPTFTPLHKLSSFQRLLESE